MKLGESLEDYLEALLILEEKNTKVRGVDVAKMLAVSKPSVNKAMNILKTKGYVDQQSYGELYLSAKGKSYAQKIYSRHVMITRFLTEILLVDPISANEEACHIEHVISDDTFHKMVEYLKVKTDN